MPSKIDPEPYFFRWESCVALGSKDQPELINHPCYKHKTCGLLIKVPENRIPPVICPNCNKDTKKEAELEEKLKEGGGVILETPSVPAHLKPETFK